MYPQSTYEPIWQHAKDWPIVRLQQKLTEFLQAVSKKAAADIFANQADHAAFRQELSRALASEQERLQRRPWKVDRKDEQAFWSQIIAELNQNQIDLSTIINKMVGRYTQEIAGGFSLWHYRLAQGTASYALNRLLNPLKPRRLRTLAQIKAQLQEQIQILGSVESIRELAKHGTIVMVPTHCSHFDSVLIWWVIGLIGLPPFTYGAGRNLFNQQFFAYFMNKLGTYKIDRRRKNVVYLATLKAYSSMILHWGCHNLFYPGGTRSRAGSIEEHLKLGLLGTVVEAQQLNYQRQDQSAAKIFVVPVTFSYHFVLEAPLLIRHYLSTQGINYQDTTSLPYSHVYKLFKLMKDVATTNSSILVSIGQPLDVLGNPVNEKGESINKSGEQINLDQLLNETTSEAHMKLYTRNLGQAVADSYRRYNYVISSHLLAFTAFLLLRQQYKHLGDQDFFQLPVENRVLTYAQLEKAFENIRKAILDLQLQNKIQVADHLQTGSIAGMIIHGLANLGIYHVRKPLIRDRAGDIIVQDLPTLFYYHNRLTGYGLEKTRE